MGPQVYKEMLKIFHKHIFPYLAHSLTLLKFSTNILLFCSLFLYLANFY